MTDAWSYSQLTTFMRCPLQHFFRYVLRLPERSTSGPLALGSAVHQALARFHRSVQQGRPIPPSAVRDTFLASWKERKEKELIVYPKGTEQGHIDQGVALLDTYLKEPVPRGIVAVEQEILVPLATSDGEILDRQLVAVLDLVDRQEGQLRVTDFKASSRSYSDMDVKLSLQATAYLYAAKEHYEEDAVFEYQILVKTRKPKVQRIATARMPTDFGRLGDLVQVIDRAVQAGIHFPVESPNNCATCPHRRPCREWQADQTLPPQKDRTSLPILEDEIGAD